LGSATRNIVPGSTCITFPINSIDSSLATARGKWLAVNAIRAGQNQILFAQKSSGHPPPIR
jgi:hypothetical protein